MISEQCNIDKPFAFLEDGSALYPAYFYALQNGHQVRRRMGHFDGAMGEWVGATREGKLYRQVRWWGSSVPHPERWEVFILG